MSSSYVYLVYSFNNNFNYSFYGTISDFISSDLNSCCNNFPLETTNVLHNFLFSSLAQKYCLIEISSLFILNKDIKIVNPAEKKPIYPLQNVTCENYSDIKVIQNIHNFETMKNIEKCTTNFFSLKKACPDINFINKTFEFSFSCSAKFPYEINETHRCVEYCNNDSLLKGECKSSFLNDGSFDNISDIVSSINNDYNEGNIYDNISNFNSNINNDEYKGNISDILSDRISDENEGNISDNISNINNDGYEDNISDILRSSIIIAEYKKNIYDILKIIINDEHIENILKNITNLFHDEYYQTEIDNILKEGKNIIESSHNNLYQITNSEHQKNAQNINISTIILNDCETTLKDIYKINKNKSLFILKVDTFIDGLKIPIIQYEIYHPETKEKLELNYCNKSKIEINIPVSIDENELYKYDLKSDYYNDICFPYQSDNGADVPLKYRRESFVNKNMSLCESQCEFLGYNNKTKSSKCECGFKNIMSLFDIKMNKEFFYDKFVNVSSLNIDIIKCYYLLFKKEYIIKNIGSYILIFIIIIFIVGLFLFWYRDYHLLNKQIDLIISIKEKNLNIKRTSGALGLIKNENNKNKKQNEIKENKNLKKVKNNPPIKKNKKRKTMITKNNNFKLNLNEDIDTSLKRIKKSNTKEIKKKKGKKQKHLSQSNIMVSDGSKINFNIIKTGTRSKKPKELYLNDFELNVLEYNIFGI